MQDISSFRNRLTRTTCHMSADGIPFDKGQVMNCNPQNQHSMTTMKQRAQSTPLDELFNGFFGRDLSQFVGSDELHRSAPRVNITEGKDGFSLDLLAPGFRKEDLKMSVEDSTLTISAEKKNQTLSEGDRYTRREFGFNAFKRSFRLPENVSPESIKAEFTNGVLTVSIPKTEPVKPAVREISIA